MSNDLLSVGDDNDLWMGDDDDEMSGDDDMLLGADDDLLLGDDYIAGPRRRRPPKVKRMRFYQPNGQTQITPFPLAEGGALEVPAGATHTLVTRPQRTMQTQRLVWASTVSPFFRITQLFIGAESMFTTQGGRVPAEIFSQTGVGVTLRGYLARSGVDIALTVTNTDANPHPAEVAIIGAVLL